jgi:hypothetical protein
MTAPPRFGDATCPFRTDARLPNLTFDQPCSMSGFWTVTVTLPANRRTANYPLPSPEVAVNANFNHGLTESYVTAGQSAGKPPSLRVTGGTINVINTGSSSGEVSVDIQFESSILETMSLVAQASYSDCLPTTEMDCVD